MSEKIKISKVKEIKELNYLKGFLVEYDTPVSKKTWEMVSRHGLDRLEDEIFHGGSYCDAVMIVAKERETGKLVLLREYRVTAGNYIYMFPAGLVDRGESIESAAIREFKEETGMDLQVHSVTKERYTSIGITNEKISIVYGFFTGVPCMKYLEESEDAEALIIGKEEAIKILETEEVSIRSAMLLEHYFNLNDFMMPDSK